MVIHSILAVPRILERDLRCCTWDVLEPLSWSTLPSLLNVESYCSTQPPPCSELNPTSPKVCLQLHCQRASVLLASCLLLLLWQLASSLPLLLYCLLVSQLASLRPPIYHLPRKKHFHCTFLSFAHNRKSQHPLYKMMNWTVFKVHVATTWMTQCVQ